MTSRTGKTYDSLLRDAARRLEDGGIETAMLDARRLLGHASNSDLAALICQSRDLPCQQTVERFETFLSARLSGKPVHRILEKREFFGRTFKVLDDVLEPRPETELLVERILEDWKDRLGIGKIDSVWLQFAEIGIGSGVIAITLLAELAGSRCIATDVSAKAIAASRINAQLHGVDGRLSLQRAEYLDGVTSGLDFIVSNPTYIKSKDILGLAREVRAYDPLVGLDGGASGLEIYAGILARGLDHLKPDGRLYLETGHGQHFEIIEMAVKNGWQLVSSHLDLCGLERILVFERTSLENVAKITC